MLLAVFYFYSFDSLGPTTQLPKAPRKVVVSLGSRGLVEQSILCVNMHVEGARMCGSENILGCWSVPST